MVKIAGGDAGSSGADEDLPEGAFARLRDGSPVGAWMFKAHPDVWDIGAALRAGVELDWWRMAPSYRVGLVAPGQPCALWVTKGDPRVHSGVWAVGQIDGEVFEDVGDPEDDLWRDSSAQQQLRPRVPIRLKIFDQPLPREAVIEDPRTSSIEILRVPRIGNPASLTPDEWCALLDLVDLDPLA